MSISFIVFGIKNFLMQEIVEMVKKTNQKKLLSNIIYRYRKIVSQTEKTYHLPSFYLETLSFSF